MVTLSFVPRSPQRSVLLSRTSTLHHTHYTSDYTYEMLHNSHTTQADNHAITAAAAGGIDANKQPAGLESPLTQQLASPTSSK